MLKKILLPMLLLALMAVSGTALALHTGTPTIEPVGLLGSAFSDRQNNYLDHVLYEAAMSGDIVFTVSPATLVSDPISEAWTRTVTVTVETAAGLDHIWLDQAIATGVSIANTSTAGTATIPSTTLTFVDGVATVVVSGDAEDWLNTETDTLTVAEATILGYTIAAKTSVETFTTP